MLVAGLAAGCAGDTSSGDTLAPLPVPEPVDTTVPPPPSTSSVPPSTTTTTIAAQPTGEWDGARFDIGTIERIGEDGDYRTIDFDRYSYQDPEIGLVDAAGLSAEPRPLWWEGDGPFENNRDDVREFVLAPSVELLRLSEEATEAACTDPPPPQRPEPLWAGVDISFLRTGAARRQIAILTYAPNGPVIRIRFTRGCD